MKSSTVINQLNNEEKKSGLWEDYFRNGSISSTGEYTNGRTEDYLKPGNLRTILKVDFG